MNPALQKLYFKSFMTLRPGKFVTFTLSDTEYISNICDILQILDFIEQCLFLFITIIY